MNKIKYLLSFMLVLLVSVPVFASNIGRNVYGIYTETYSGAHFGSDTSDYDLISFMLWNDQRMKAENMHYKDDPDSNFIEGEEYIRLTATSTGKWPYGGGGYVAVNSGNSKDMSTYKAEGKGKIKFWVRSQYKAAKALTIGLKFDDGTESGKEIYFKTLGQLGLNDDAINGNKWVELTIDLKDYDQVTDSLLEKTMILFMFFYPENYDKLKEILSDSCPTESEYKGYSYNAFVNKYIDIDNIRWVKETATPPTFKVTVKNVDGNTVADDNPSAVNISWAGSSYGSGWTAAQQYLTISLDDVFTANNWSIHIRTNNGDSEHNGYIVPEDKSLEGLQLCWRIIKGEAPLSNIKDNNKDSIFIAQSTAEGSNLYDANKGDGYYPWLYMKDFSSVNRTTMGDKYYEYTAIWNYRGIHYALPYKDPTYGDQDGWGSLLDLADRTVYLYIGCNTANAAASKYGTKIYLDLDYE